MPRKKRITPYLIFPHPSGGVGVKKQGAKRNLFVCENITKALVKFSNKGLYGNLVPVNLVLDKTVLGVIERINKRVVKQLVRDKQIERRVARIALSRKSKNKKSVAKNVGGSVEPIETGAYSVHYQRGGTTAVKPVEIKVSAESDFKIIEDEVSKTVYPPENQHIYPGPAPEPTETNREPRSYQTWPEPVNAIEQTEKESRIKKILTNMAVWLSALALTWGATSVMNSYIKLAKRNMRDAQRKQKAEAKRLSKPENRPDLYRKVIKKGLLWDSIEYHEREIPLTNKPN
jgi:hypothetical protein